MSLDLDLTFPAKFRAAAAVTQGHNKQIVRAIQWSKHKSQVMTGVAYSVKCWSICARLVEQTSALLIVCLKSPVDRVFKFNLKVCFGGTMYISCTNSKTSPELQNYPKRLIYRNCLYWTKQLAKVRIRENASTTVKHAHLAHGRCKATGLIPLAKVQTTSQ